MRCNETAGEGEKWGMAGWLDIRAEMGDVDKGAILISCLVNT